jgi:hypothetical protein
LGCTIEVTLTPPGPVAAGSEVLVRVVARSERRVRCGSILCEAGWRTDGRGEKDRGCLLEKRAPGGELGPEHPLLAEFEFAVPCEGPLTYVGRRFSRASLLSIEWGVRVELDVPEVPNPQRHVVFEVVPRASADEARGPRL